MVITFMVGNGFDLNIGLKTAFSDFLDEYIQEKDSDNANIIQFKKTILKKQKSWGYAEREFGKITKEFVANGKTADDYYECYDNFCENLAVYLSAQENRIKFEHMKEKIIQAFSSSINIMSIIKSFSAVQNEELLNAVSLFGEGFKYNFIDFNYTKTLDSCISIVTKAPGALGSRKVGRDNYNNSISQVVHVHGDTSMNMILGVNDKSQIAGIELFDGHGAEYVDQIIKVKANAMNEENTDRRAETLLQAADLIYIYGMSLGETDKLWWDRVLTHMVSHPNVHVIIHCHSAPQKALLQRRYKTWEREKKEKFLSNLHGTIEDSMKQSLFRRIHLDTNNIFASLCGLELDAEARNPEKTLIEV
jgi:hypothetical protein